MGGDDTRFQYAYPALVLKSLTLFSWNNISSFPSYLPNHQSIPFLIIASILDTILNNKIHLFYFLFSLPLILGFIYFQKFIRELIGKEYLISFTTALIYILSPIIIVSHISHFLSPVWLISLVPIIAYYYICYVRRRNNKDLLKAVAWSVFLSMAYYAIVWVLGVLLPLMCGMILSFIFVGNRLKGKIKKTVTYIIFIASSQLFWLIPFVMSLINSGGGELGVKPIAKSVINSFAPTVNATATGNIMYPLLTFYHRQIVFDFDGQLKNVFLTYFDHILPFSLIFVLVLFLGVINYKKVLSRFNKKIFIFFFVSFIAGLYFFTVNIGILKYVFILFGYIPGFSVFRNFTDKFSLGYIFAYASILSFCFLVIKKSLPKIYFLLLFITIIVVIINFIPAKQIIASPVWRTKDIYQTINLPKEYLSFIDKVKQIIPNTSNVIDFPQANASYATITENDGRYVYSGTSPFKFLTGVNDFSGNSSYTTSIADSIRKSIMKRNYKELIYILSKINVGYVMVINNIPDQIKKSYLYDKSYLVFQDKKLIDSIVDREIIKSSSGNYVIYSLKDIPKILSSTGNISFKKISPIEYRINVINLRTNQKLFFYDTYHPGWKLYVSSKKTARALVVNELSHLFDRPIFDNSHSSLIPYGNQWVINPKSIIDASGALYVRNKDGSINAELTLYFFPQLYFYLGILIAVISLSIVSLYVIKYRKNDIN